MTRRSSRARGALLPLLVLCLLAVSACDPAEKAPRKSQPRVAVADITEYVAMGDSFVSGPLITPLTDDTGICGRSTRNYPHVLAKELGIPELKDVSCNGAMSYHLLQDVADPRETVPAQVKALSESTRLVTVGIGYNNDAFFQTLMPLCGPAAPAKGTACEDFADDQVPDLLKSQRSQVVDALRSIRVDAPNATVLLVGYLPLIPTSDECPAEQWPLANQQTYHGIEVDVDDGLREVAADAGIAFLSMRRAGRDHGMCAGEDAWVNGATAAPGDGEIVHPRAVGMRAVAREVATFLRSYGS